MPDLLDVKEKHESELLAIPGVAGVGADLKTKTIVVYVETADVCARLPKTLEGYPVRCEVVGKIGVMP